MPAETGKKCVSLEKDLIIAAQRRKIDSLHDESHKLRRQRDELLQRLQRAEAKPAAAVGCRGTSVGGGSEMKKSRSLSANAPSSCSGGPKASFSDFCLAEKVKVSQAAAATRKVCRSGLLVHDLSSSSSAIALHRVLASAGSAAQQTPLMSCGGVDTAAAARRRGIGRSIAATASSHVQTSRDSSRSATERGGRNREHDDSATTRRDFALSRSPGRAAAASVPVGSATPSQKRLAAEIIQYQYRQHALNKSFERLKNRSASSRASLDGARAPALEPDDVDRHHARCCTQSELSDAAAAAALVASHDEGSTSWSPVLAMPRWPTLAGRDEDELEPMQSAAAMSVVMHNSFCWRSAGVTSSCRGVDGPSALCEKELEEADTSIFEASYTSASTAATPTGYCVPPSPYDNVSADDQPKRYSDVDESSSALGRGCVRDVRADRYSPASADGDAACDMEDARCLQAEPSAAALVARCRSFHQDGDRVSVVGRNISARDDESGGLLSLPSLRPSPRQATVLSASLSDDCQCQPMKDDIVVRSRLVRCCDSQCRCRRSSSPTQSTAPSVASAAASAAAATAQAAGWAERRLGGEIAGVARALSCRTVPSSPSSRPDAALEQGGWPSQAAERERKRQYRIGLNIFNKKPEQGIEYLAERSFVERTPRSVAHFLLTRKGISKQLVGEYLGNLMQPFNQEVLRSFVNQLDFKGLELDTAMRQFTSIFRLPGEAQKIERIVEVFSQRYCHCNPSFAAQFRTADTVFVLAFSVILLNTDLHNPNIKAARRMHLEGFVNNMKGIDAGCDVDRDLLVGIYERIQQAELKPCSDHTTQVRKVEENIVEKRCAVPNLAVPYRRLVCYCRLYEVRDPSKKDRSGAHQREVFLFNDLLVITKIFSKKKNSITYSFRGSYPLIDLKVTTFEADHYSYGIRLAVAADSRTLAFFNARNSHDREKFVDDLRESIQEMNEMESVRLSKASCRGIDDPSSAPTLSPLLHQKQQAPSPPLSATDRHSKDSGVVVCATSGLLMASPRQRLRSPSVDAAAGGHVLESDGRASYSPAGDAHDGLPDSGRELGHQQPHQQQRDDEPWQVPHHQYAGSDVEADMVEKRHSSGSIDSGMVSTSTGSVAEARDEEGSPRQPVVRAAAAVRVPPICQPTLSASTSVTRRDCLVQPLVAQPADATPRLQQAGGGNGIGGAC